MSDLTLQAYLLGQVDFEDMFALQRRLVYEVSGGEAPCLLLCEHTGTLTVGRHGSRAHILSKNNELDQLWWQMRWVNRGGGCWLQVPGQLAIYPILPLRRCRLTLQDYLHSLQRVLLTVLRDLEIRGKILAGSPDVWVDGRPIACIGVAVRDWVTYYGAILNVNPDLFPLQGIRSGKHYPPMTSLARERRMPIAPAFVRQRLVEHFATRFGFARTLLFTDHPLLRREVASHAIAAAR